MVILEDFNNFFEMFKGNSLGILLAILPVLMLASPVHSAKDFTVYRMQQFDLQSIGHGSKAVGINMEARAVGGDTVMRRCVLVQLREFTASLYKDLVSQNAGGILILLPSDVDSLSDDEKKQVIAVEQELLSEQTAVPVYFTVATEEIENVYANVVQSSTSQSGSASNALLSAVSANGFQVVVNGGSSAPLSNFQVVNIHGVLGGSGVEENLPSIVITAHYDAFGVAPSLSTGADSNGSGVAMLLELARLFSKLYSDAKTHPRYNIVFLLSGAGKFNYFGTKKWLDEFHESNKFPYLSDVAAVLCLDTMARGGHVYAHVSKPPKEGSSSYSLLKSIEAGAKREGMEYELVHKKIRLGEPTLAWEHEQWSIHRLPAFTLSTLPTHKDPARASITDTRSAVSSQNLASMTRIVAESVAQVIYNITTSGGEAVEVFRDDLAVSESVLSSWLDVLSSGSRAAQLLDKTHPLLSSMEQALTHSLLSASEGSKAQRSMYTAEKREPEMVFYGNAEETMHAYNVKPAVFDLVLASGICAYLGVVYLAAQKFNLLYGLLRVSAVTKKIS